MTNKILSISRTSSGEVSPQNKIINTRHPAARRFCARMLDTCLETIILLAMDVLVSFVSAVLCVYILVALPILVFLVDACIYRIFGNTAGKALLGIRVTHEGKQISALQFACRNMRVWIYGFGVTLPLISLVCMAVQWNAIRIRGQATYDVKNDITIEFTPVSKTRILIAVLIAIACYSPILAFHLFMSAVGMVHH